MALLTKKQKEMIKVIFENNNLSNLSLEQRKIIKLVISNNLSDLKVEDKISLLNKIKTRSITLDADEKEKIKSFLRKSSKADALTSDQKQKTMLLIKAKMLNLSPEERKIQLEKEKLELAEKLEAQKKRKMEQAQKEIALRKKLKDANLSTKEIEDQVNKLKAEFDENPDKFRPKTTVIEHKETVLKEEARVEIASVIRIENKEEQDFLLRVKSLKFNQKELVIELLKNGLLYFTNEQRASLKRAIIENWDYISDEIKQKILSYVKVDFANLPSNEQKDLKEFSDVVRKWEIDKELNNINFNKFLNTKEKAILKRYHSVEFSKLTQLEKEELNKLFATKWGMLDDISQEKAFNDAYEGNFMFTDEERAVIKAQLEDEQIQNYRNVLDEEYANFSMMEKNALFKAYQLQTNQTLKFTEEERTAFIKLIITNYSKLPKEIKGSISTLVKNKKLILSPEQLAKVKKIVLFEQNKNKNVTNYYIKLSNEFSNLEKALIIKVNIDKAFEFITENEKAILVEMMLNKWVAFGKETKEALLAAQKNKLLPFTTDQNAEFMAKLSTQSVFGSRVVEETKITLNNKFNVKEKILLVKVKLAGLGKLTPKETHQLIALMTTKWLYLDGDIKPILIDAIKLNKILLSKEQKAVVASLVKKKHNEFINPNSPNEKVELVNVNVEMLQTLTEQQRLVIETILQKGVEVFSPKAIERIKKLILLNWNSINKSKKQQILGMIESGAIKLLDREREKLDELIAFSEARAKLNREEKRSLIEIFKNEWSTIPVENQEKIKQILTNYMKSKGKDLPSVEKSVIKKTLKGKFSKLSFNNKTILANAINSLVL